MKDKYSRKTKTPRSEVTTWSKEDIRHYAWMALYKLVTTPALFDAIVRQKCPAKGHDNTKGKRTQQHGQ